MAKYLLDDAVSDGSFQSAAGRKVRQEQERTV